MYTRTAGKFDLIVSDMNYGADQYEGGVEAMRRIPRKSATHAILTSEEDLKQLEMLAKRVDVDHFISLTLAP